MIYGRLAFLLRGGGGREDAARLAFHELPSVRCQEGGGRRRHCNRGGLCEKSFSLSLYISPPLQEEKNTGNSLSGRRRRWAYNEGGKSPLSPFSPSSADTFRTSREGRAEESGIQTGLKRQAAHTKSLLRTTVEK